MNTNWHKLYGGCTDRRVIDRGRRVEDCSPLLGLSLMLVWGFTIGCIVGYFVRVWWG